MRGHGSLFFEFSVQTGVHSAHSQSSVIHWELFWVLQWSGWCRGSGEAGEKMGKALFSWNGGLGGMQVVRTYQWLRWSQGRETGRRGDPGPGRRWHEWELMAKGTPASGLPRKWQPEWGCSRGKMACPGLGLVCVMHGGVWYFVYISSRNVGRDGQGYDVEKVPGKFRMSKKLEILEPRNLWQVQWGVWRERLERDGAGPAQGPATG